MVNRKLPHREFSTVSGECLEDTVREARILNPQNPRKELGKAGLNLINILKEADLVETTEAQLKTEFYTLYHCLYDWIAATNLKKKASEQHGQLNKHERSRSIEAYSKFNDALRDIFNRWGPEITDVDVLKNINALTGINVSPYFIDEMKKTITGVRTEMIFELAMTIMGIQTERATTEQDSQGIDYIVHIGGRDIKLDIKTSQYGADEANMRNMRHGNDVTAFCPFPRNTLRKIPTILPRDPYGQMLSPALMMAKRLSDEMIITNEQYMSIEEDLAQQIKKMEERAAYA